MYISYIFGLLSVKALNSFPPGFFNGTGFSINTVSSGDHSGSGLTQTGNDANLEAAKVITAKVSTHVEFVSA